MTEFVLVPVEPTDEMIRVSLATEWPATYRDHLRHPANGLSSANQTEKLIERERTRYAAVLAAAPEPLRLSELQEDQGFTASRDLGEAPVAQEAEGWAHDPAAAIWAADCLASDVVEACTDSDGDLLPDCDRHALISAILYREQRLGPDGFHKLPAPQKNFARYKARYAVIDELLPQPPVQQAEGEGSRAEIDPSPPLTTNQGSEP